MVWRDVLAIEAWVYVVGIASYVCVQLQPLSSSCHLLLVPMQYNANVGYYTDLKVL